MPDGLTNNSWVSADDGPRRAGLPAQRCGDMAVSSLLEQAILGFEYVMRASGAEAICIVVSSCWREVQQPVPAGDCVHVSML